MPARWWLVLVAATVAAAAAAPLARAPEVNATAAPKVEAVQRRSYNADGEWFDDNIDYPPAPEPGTGDSQGTESPDAFQSPVEPGGGDLAGSTGAGYPSPGDTGAGYPDPGYPSAGDAGAGYPSAGSGPMDAGSGDDGIDPPAWSGDVPDPIYYSGAGELDASGDDASWLGSGGPPLPGDDTAGLPQPGDGSDTPLPGDGSDLPLPTEETGLEVPLPTEGTDLNLGNDEEPLDLSLGTDEEPLDLSWDNGDTDLDAAPSPTEQLFFDQDDNVDLNIQPTQTQGLDLTNLDGTDDSIPLGEDEDIGLSFGHEKLDHFQKGLSTVGACVFDCKDEPDMKACVQWVVAQVSGNDKQMAGLLVNLGCQGCDFMRPSQDLCPQPSTASVLASPSAVAGVAAVVVLALVVVASVMLARRKKRQASVDVAPLINRALSRQVSRVSVRPAANAMEI